MFLVMIVVRVEVVMGVMHFVDHGTAGHEEHALGHGVVEQMEQGCAERHDDNGVVGVIVRVLGSVGQVFVPVQGVGEVECSAQTGENVGELGHGGIRQDLLEVVLDKRNGCGHDSGCSTDGGDDERQVSEVVVEVIRAKEREHPGHEVEACVDHGGGVDEGRNGRRSFHCIGQPNVQRELSGLTDRTDEHQTERPRQRAGPRLCDGLDVLVVKDHGVVEGALTSTSVWMEQRPQHGEADHQEHVPNTGGEEGFLGSVSGAGPLVVEPDEQVRAETHQLPENEEPEERVGQHHPQHTGAEQDEFCVKPMISVVVDGVGVHVSDGEGVDEEAEERGDEEEHHRDVVNVNAESEVDFGNGGLTGIPHAGGEPRPSARVGTTGPPDEIRHQPQREQQARRHDGEGDEASFLESVLPHFVAVEHFPEEQNHGKGQHGQENDVRSELQRRCGCDCFHSI